MKTCSELVNALMRYGLLDPDRIDALIRRLSKRNADPYRVVKKLIENEWLTRFQAGRVLEDCAEDLLVGPYLLLEQLGEGGMATVYKARHRYLDRVVALKVVRPELVQDPEVLQRFHREARAAARLSHPNIVVAFDAEEAGGKYFMSMEYLDGKDLYRLILDRGPISMLLTREYTRQAALGLQHAHEQGLVHRDVKPHNLFLQKPPRGRTAFGPVIKLLDLGMAMSRALGEQDHAFDRLTLSGRVLGTADYISPEQAQRSHHVDIRSDLYSLGCCMYYLLSGAPPFPSGSVSDKLTSHIHRKPGPIEIRCQDLPPAFAAIINRLVEKNPDRRFQTPGELADALTRIQFPPVATG